VVLLYLVLAALVIYLVFDWAVRYFQSSLIIYSDVDVGEILSKAGTLEANDMVWESLADKSGLILNRARGLAEKLRQEEIISSQFCKYMIDLVCQQRKIVTCNPGIIIESVILELNFIKETQLREKNEDLYNRIREYNKEVWKLRFYINVANYFFNPNKRFYSKSRLVKVY